jgi:hypothetical protein
VASSVLEEIVERGPHGRHSQKFGYRVRAREDQVIRVKKAQRGWLGQRLAPPAKAVVISPSVFEIRAMDEEIRAAQFILRIENDFDSADFVPYTEETLSLATAFLRRLMIAAHSAGVFGIGVPQIGPADHGSIDLFWEKTDRTLLMNFPCLESVASFYGKKPAGEISGRTDPSQSALELAYWLVS